MERDRFVGAVGESWWLVERDVDYRVAEGRNTLGDGFGWTHPEWYTDQQKLDEIYRLMENAHRVLLDDLDQPMDADRQTRWLTDLHAALRPVPAQPAPAGSAAAAPDHAPAPAAEAE